MSDDRSISIGFIGLGNMGGPMAMRLLDAGLDVSVCDIRPEALEPFRARGVPTSTHPREIADRAELVFASMSSAAASLDVALGPGGIVDGRVIRIYVELSTIGGRTAIRIAEDLAAHGIAFIDSPVSGGAAGAKAGTLSAMASGPLGVFESVRPVLALMAPSIFYLGEKAGNAQTAKLINNHISYAGKVTAFEGVVLGVKAGLDPKLLVDVINASTGRNSTTINKFATAIFNRSFNSGSALSIGIKDVELFLDEAERLEVPNWIGRTTLEFFREAAAEGYRDRDNMLLYRYIERLAGIEDEEEGSQAT